MDSCPTDKSQNIVVTEGISAFLLLLVALKDWFGFQQTPVFLLTLKLAVRRGCCYSESSDKTIISQHNIL